MSETPFVAQITTNPPASQTLFAVILSYLPLLLIIWIPIIGYLWGKYNKSYWSRNRVPFIPGNLLVGNLLPHLKYEKSPSELFEQLYNDHRIADHPVGGIHFFHKPALLIRDPELIRCILVKDFNSFNDRHSASDPVGDHVGNDNLFFIKNPVWKYLRTRLTPTFTSGKMKQMFGLVDDIGSQLDEALISTTSKGDCETEIKDVCARYTTDVIASCVLGVNAKSIQNPNSEFCQSGRSMFKFNWYRAIEFSSIFFLPEICSIFRFKTFSKEATDFIRSAINTVMAERERSGTVRNDLIDTLITLKRDDVGKRLTKTENIVLEGDTLVAQAAVFFSAGFETSSALMSFTLFELAWQPKLQNRLREEIRNVLMAGKEPIDINKLSYDKINGMEYLHMVVSETLRMYPPLPFLDRLCTVNSSPNEKLDDQNSYDLNPIFNFKIPKGMLVLIPIHAIQHDPKYFPKPHHFDPERFSTENKSNIKPYTYMPFGTGPRNCIGDRFGLMQAKVGLINFLKNHMVEPSPKTPRTIKYEPKSLVTQAQGGVYLNIVKKPLFE